MEIFSFFKEKWNLVLEFSLAVVVVVSEIVVPPNISFSFAESEVNYEVLSKFIVAGTILLTMIPCLLNNKRKHMRWWWIAAIVSFVLSIVLFFGYNRLLNEVSAYNSYAEERVIIGDKLRPIAQRAVDSVKRVDNLDELTDSDLVERLGEPTDIWPKREIEKNSRLVILCYMMTVILFSLFILFSIQALYCLQKEGMQ